MSVPLSVRRWPTQLRAISLLSLGVCLTSAATLTAQDKKTTTTIPPAVAPAVKNANPGPKPDARVGLKAGLQDAGEAIWNMKMVSHRASPPGFETNTNSDLAFTGNLVLQGNYNGLVAWDIADPKNPVLKVANLCPSSQDDISVVGNLAFMSSEQGSRLDCAVGGGRGTVATPGVGMIRGLRVFDITDIAKPKYLANIQTCRGSHTHTLYEDPNDKENVYVYISGTSGIRTDIPRCIADATDPNTTNFAIEVYKVPLAHPENYSLVTQARIFADPKTGELGALRSPGQHGAAPTGATPAAAPVMTAAEKAAAARDSINIAKMAKDLKSTADRVMLRVALRPTSKAADTLRFNKTADSLRAAGYPAPAAVGTAASGGRGGGRGGLSQCHDITVYPAVGLAGGACAGMGLLLDTKIPGSPVRLDAVGDTNFSYWHSATFSNDGSKVLFSDEWGGGGQANCKKTDPQEWGGDAIFAIVNGKMKFKSYYKMPAAQTAQENCVAHNGSLIPIPGRDIMVQAFYQGGLTMFEWTDPAHPVEIGYFDRGPNDSTKLASGGYWSVYWYNGYIVGSEIKRGLDVFELTPSAAISQNEIDAAKTVKYDHLNVQGQPKIVWPASFAKAKAFVDQLERNGSISALKVKEIRAGIAKAEAASGAEQKAELTKVTKSVGLAMSRDATKAKMLVSALNELAQ